MRRSRAGMKCISVKKMFKQKINIVFLFILISSCLFNYSSLKPRNHFMQHKISSTMLFKCLDVLRNSFSCLPSKTLQFSWSIYFSVIFSLISKITKTSKISDFLVNDFLLATKKIVGENYFRVF